MTIKAHYMSNPKQPKRWTSRSIAQDMTPNQRLTYDLGPALGAEMMVQPPSTFLNQGLGRIKSWPADRLAHAPATQIFQHPDGTVDVVRLDSTRTHYIDLGGQGARDCAARRP